MNKREEVARLRREAEVNNASLTKLRDQADALRSQLSLAEQQVFILTFSLSPVSLSHFLVGACNASYLSLCLIRAHPPWCLLSYQCPLQVTSLTRDNDAIGSFRSQVCVAHLFFFSFFLLFFFFFSWLSCFPFIL